MRSKKYSISIILLSLFILYSCGSTDSSIKEQNNYALEFDANDDVLDIPDQLNLSNSSFTIELWASTYSWDNEHDENKFAFLLIDIRSNALAWLGLFKDDGNVNDKQFYFASSESRDSKFLNSNTEIQLNKWYHIACVYNLETGMKSIYINGQLKNSENQGQIGPGSKSSLVGNSNSLQHTFHGAIDEVRIWNIARSQNEILHSMSNRLTGNEEGLIVYYPFEEGSGQVTSSLTSIPDAVLGLNESADQADPTWIVR